MISWSHRIRPRLPTSGFLLHERIHPCMFKQLLFLDSFSLQFLMTQKEMLYTQIFMDATIAGLVEHRQFSHCFSLPKFLMTIKIFIRKKSFNFQLTKSKKKWRNSGQGNTYVNIHNLPMWFSLERIWGFWQGQKGNPIRPTFSIVLLSQKAWQILRGSRAFQAWNY